MYLILFVLHNTDDLEDVLQAWEATGINGVTILASAGLARLRERSALRDDLPLIPRLQDILCHDEKLSRTIFTIVDSDELVDKVVAATQAIVGDLDEPNTGILSVIPLARVYGLSRRKNELGL